MAASPPIVKSIYSDQWTAPSEDPLSSAVTKSSHLVKISVKITRCKSATELSLLRHFCCEKREAQVGWVTDIIRMKVRWCAKEMLQQEWVHAVMLGVQEKYVYPLSNPFTVLLQSKNISECDIYIADSSSFSLPYLDERYTLLRPGINHLLQSISQNKEIW